MILGSPGFVKLSFRRHDLKLGFVTIKEMPTMFFIPDHLAFIPGNVAAAWKQFYKKNSRVTLFIWQQVLVFWFGNMLA